MGSENHPPGPRGELAGVQALDQWRRYGVAFLARAAATYGDVVRLEIGDYPIYLLNHPDLVKEAFFDHHQDLRKPQCLEVSNRGHWGDGLTSLGGDAWRRRKQQLRPIFHRREMMRWSGFVVECAAAMAAGWRPGREISLYEELVDLRARIAAHTVLDAAVTPHAAGSRVAGTPSDEARDVVPLDEARGREFVLTPENSRVPFWGLRRPRAAARVDEMVALIRQRLAEPGDHAGALAHLAAVRDDDGRPLAADDIADEILQMFYAGHLTVPTWLTQLWWALWVFPELDARVSGEARRILEGRLPAFEDLPRLILGEQVIQETGRYFAPAPVLYREVANPFSVAGYVLEEGAGVWVCPQLLHHDPRNFEDPHEFRPQRFDVDNFRRISRYAYLPFGAGPRTCIAKSSAMVEMHLILATICRDRRLVPVVPADSRVLHGMPAPGALIMRVEERHPNEGS